VGLYVVLSGCFGFGFLWQDMILARIFLFGLAAARWVVVVVTLTESLILAQDERWRRA
jgi:hypothetical protein